MRCSQHRLRQLEFGIWADAGRTGAAGVKKGSDSSQSKLLPDICTIRASTFSNHTIRSVSRANRRARNQFGPASEICPMGRFTERDCLIPISSLGWLSNHGQSGSHVWVPVLCAAGVPDLLAAMDISRLTVGEPCLSLPKNPVRIYRTFSYEKLSEATSKQRSHCVLNRKSASPGEELSPRRTSVSVRRVCLGLTRS
jgi:hypothetical protein